MNDTEIASIGTNSEEPYHFVPDESVEWDLESGNFHYSNPEAVESEIVRISPTRRFSFLKKVLNFVVKRKPKTSSTSDTPEVDYLSPPEYYTLPEETHPDHWDWIRNILEFWRNEEGCPYTGTYEEPSNTPICPITWEPTHHTIPLLISRIDRCERNNDHVHGIIDAAPELDQFEDLRTDVQHIGHECRNLRSNFELAGIDRDRIPRLEYELGNARREVSRLQNLVEGLYVTMAAMHAGIRELEEKVQQQQWMMGTSS